MNTIFETQNIDEKFYKSQSHYFLYKNQKEKARKSMIKAVDSNDLLTAERKKEFRSENPAKMRNYGISFCK